jgi:REP-associated tyrosine transposase
MLYNVSMDYAHTGHAVNLLVYHLVWCPKYRRSVLMPEIAARMRELVAELAAEHSWQVLKLAIQPDHVHLFLRTLPTDAPHLVVRAIKGRTSRILRKEFPSLRRRLPTLWTRSYFCATAGNVSAATIQRYIQAQTGV